MQLRYLDLNGNEIIRIDRNTYESIPYVINNKNLQNKYKRYYFKDTLSKKENEIWYSKIDLNKERGEIEKTN